MLKHSFISIAAILLLAAGTAAQDQEKPAQQKPAVQQKEETRQPPPSRGTLANVRIELTISDQMAPASDSKKVVTMMVADGYNSSIRTSGWVMTKEGRRDVNINVDARPVIAPNRENLVRLELGIQYQPTGSTRPPGDPRKSEEQNFSEFSQTGLTERIFTLLESGKPLVISEAADPASDRRIRVEVRATIVR